MRSSFPVAVWPTGMRTPGKNGFDRNQPRRTQRKGLTTAIFPEVIARLREDDRILELDDIEYLEVYFTFDGWPNTLRHLLPHQMLRHVARSVRQLYCNAAGMADRPYFPDTRSPNGRVGLKADDDVIVALSRP